MDMHPPSWEDIKATWESREPEDEIIIISHLVVMHNGKKARSVHAISNLPEGGKTLCEVIVNNAIQLGDLEGMNQMAEAMINIGMSAKRSIKAISDNLSSKN